MSAARTIVSSLAVVIALWGKTSEAGSPRLRCSCAVKDSLALYMFDSPVGSYVHVLEFDPKSGGVEWVRIDAEVLGGMPAIEGAGSCQKLALEERREYGVDGRLTRAYERMTTSTGENSWSFSADGSGRWVLRRLIGGVTTARVYGYSPPDRIDRSCLLYQRMRNREIRRGDVWYDTSFDLVSGRVVVTRCECLFVPESSNGYVWGFVSVDSAVGLEERWITDTSGVSLYRSVPPFFEGRHPNWKRSEDVTRVRQGETGGGRSPWELLWTPAKQAPTSDGDVLLEIEAGRTLAQTGETFYRREGSRWRLRPFLRTCPRDLRKTAWRVSDRADTANTPTLQSAHHRIRTLAESLSVSVRDHGCELVETLCRYVHSNIQYRLHAIFSSALETISAGYGDCGEKAVLLAALLRAQGLPAHVIVGLTYVPERGGYLGHAWVGIRTSSGWLCADPTSGQFPAFVGLVPLAIDDDGTGAIELLRLVDHVTITHSPR